MNKRFYVLTLISALCCLLIFILYPSFKLSQPTIPLEKNSLYNGQNTTFFGLIDRKAFATVICDNEMLEPTMVSIHSLKQSKTDIIVLFPESITIKTDHIQRLEKLGARVIRVPASSSSLLNSCDSALLNLWTLFGYKKIVYFSPDVVFKKNHGQLLDHPVGSALITQDSDIPLLILEPSSYSFDMFTHHYKKNPNLSFINLLEKSFLIDYKSSLTLDTLSKNAIVYTGPMKPWNFHAYGETDWKKHYNPISFYQWRSISNEIRHLFDPNSDWKNEQRQQKVCDAYVKSNPTDFPIKDQFSVMLSTYSPERIQHISLLIRHLLKSDKIHTVFVTWHNPKLSVPNTLYSEIEKKDRGRVKVLKQSFDSLNNRFNPTHELKTDAVYIMDDDIYMQLEDLEFAFSAWQTRKDSMVGHFPRLHSYNPETLEATYDINEQSPYSIILTKSMFIRSDYLFSYTCLLEPRLHATVDGQLNCEDLGFAMMASGLSGTGPTYAHTRNSIEDFGLDQGISINNLGHMDARSKCISDFITNFWNKKDPLILSNAAVTPFVITQMVPGDWNRVTNAILN